MHISPQEFARLLKSSTLSATEQHALLNLLPSLTSEQIQEIGQGLMADGEAQTVLFEEVEKRSSMMLHGFEAELKSISEEED